LGLIMVHPSPLLPLQVETKLEASAYMAVLGPLETADSAHTEEGAAPDTLLQVRLALVPLHQATLRLPQDIRLHRQASAVLVLAPHRLASRQQVLSTRRLLQRTHLHHQRMELPYHLLHRRIRQHPQATLPRHRRIHLHRQATARHHQRKLTALPHPITARRLLPIVQRHLCIARVALNLALEVTDDHQRHLLLLAIAQLARCTVQQVLLPTHIPQPRRNSLQHRQVRHHILQRRQNGLLLRRPTLLHHLNSDDSSRHAWRLKRRIISSYANPIMKNHTRRRTFN
jgi:hypothetical protein